MKQCELLYLLSIFTINSFRVSIRFSAQDFSLSFKHPHFMTLCTQSNNRNYPLIKQTNPIPFSSICAHALTSGGEASHGVCTSSNKSHLFSLFLISLIIVITISSYVHIFSGYKVFSLSTLTAILQGRVTRDHSLHFIFIYQ